MTLTECTDLLTPIALAMRVPMGVPTFRAYHGILKTVPVELAAAGLVQLCDAGLEFFPSAPVIKSAAEKVRRQQLALHPWQPCCECEDTPRWRERIDGDIKRLEPCPCVARHKSTLAERGLLEPIACLPGEAGVGENEPVYPTLEQLPAPLRAQLVEIASRKLLK